MKSRLSNWKEESDLYEVVTGKMTDKEALKKVTEKEGINNKVIINPKLSEAVKEIGGEVLYIDEQEVSDIEGAVEYFYEEGINEEGLDIIIEEVGIDDFVDFVTDVEFLTEERAARKMNVRTLKTLKTKTIPADAEKEAKRKEQKKGEYKQTPKKKSRVGVPTYTTKVKKAAAVIKKARKDFDGDGKKETPKQEHRGVRNKKIAKAVAKAKPAQPKKEVSKGGLRDKIRSAVKAGVKRHKKAVQPARVFAKGMKAGAKATVKFAGKAKKALVGEAVKGEDTQDRKDAAAERRSGTVGGVKTPKRLSPSKGREYVKGTKASIEWWRKKKEDEKENTKGQVDEAKVDTGKSADEKATARNKRNTPAGKDYDFDNKVFIARKEGESLESARTRKRREAHGKKRGVKEGFSDWRTDLQEKDLNAKERRALPDKDFVFPGKGEGPEGKQRGAYPINDKKHARAALAMAAAHASPEKEAKVKAAVKKKFPDIKIGEETAPGSTGIGSKIQSGLKKVFGKFDKSPLGKYVNKKPRPTVTQRAQQDKIQRNVTTEDRAFDTVVKALRKKHSEAGVLTKDSPKPKVDKKKAAAERKKRDADKAKAFADRAKKAGYKNPQDYANVVAQYGSEENMKKGKGLGT